MKIFALNLCLEFEVKDPSRTYDFDQISFGELMGNLFKGGEFENQKIYVSAEYSEDFVDHVFELQANDVWRDLELTICFRFDNLHSCQHFLEVFLEKFKQKDAAGGLVENEKGEYLCIYNRNRWTLPKGGVEWREEIENAAVREVKEETGIEEVVLMDKIGETYHTFRRRRNWVLKTTHWYKMKASSAEMLIPQEEESIEAVIWMSKPKWIEQGTENTYPLIRHLFEKAFAQRFLA